MSRVLAKLIGTFFVCSLLWFGILDVLSVSAAPSTTVYYVDPSGSNGNPCTAPGAAACQTIGGALGKAANGDSISVAAAIYHEHLTIGKSVTVTGAAMTATIIDGSKTERVLTVTNGASVVLIALTIRNGKAALNGGGILNDATLTLKNVAVLTNTAGTTGGGIYSSHALQLIGAYVLSNTAVFGGGVYNFGPAILSASATFSQCTLSANHAISDGGGLYSSHGVGIIDGSSTANLQNTDVGNNVAGGFGAGIYNNGTLQVSSGSNHGNSSHDTSGNGGGGGLYVKSGLVTITLSAFLFDSTLSGYGGGIYNFSGTLTISGTAFNNNGSARGGSLSTGPGGTTTSTNGDFSGNVAIYGGAVENRGRLTLANAALHQNSGSVGGGAIHTAGYLSMTNGSVFDNEALGPNDGGGGIYVNGGVAAIDTSDITGNRANVTYTVSGGGIYLAEGSVLTLTNSHVDNNVYGHTGMGGGIAAFSSTLRLANDSVDLNHGGAAGLGSGLYLLNVSATLSALNVSGNTGAFGGGGLKADQSHISIRDSTLSTNHASAVGGGISTIHSTLMMTRVNVSGNTSDSDGGGVDLYDTFAVFSVTSILGNRATAQAGGINHYLNTLSLVNSTLSGNVAQNNGGGGQGAGIYNEAGLLVVRNSTLDHNLAAQGGGIYNRSEGTSNLENVTLNANVAITGGGIYAAPGNVSPSVITLTNVTLKDNSATDGGGIDIANDANTFVFLKNTVLADSLGGGNCKGKAVTSSNYSLSTDGTCALVGSGNQNNKPALLNSLANNGGPTLTHLPKSASLLVDGVSGSDCPADDQRGQLRPVGSSCDIGAVERQLTDPDLSPLLYLPIILR